MAVCASLLVGLLAVSSCSRGDVQSEGGEVVVYSGRSETLVGPVVEMFEDATGIDVSVKYGSTSEMAATLIEEGDSTPADVFFAQDPAGLGAVAADGILSPLSGDILGRVPAWARSDDGLWIGISGRARTVVYNTETVDASRLPTTLEGFADPAWKGRIGWAPTNGSFQAMVTAMRVVWGEERTRRWLASIHANDPRTYPGNTPIVAAAATGEIDVGFVNHYYLHRFLAEEGEGFAARNHHLPGGGPGSMVMVAGAGVVAGAGNPEGAAAFIEFMLSEVAQRYFAGQTHEYPLVDGLSVGGLVTPLADLTVPEIDMADLSDLVGTQGVLRDLGIIP